MDLASRLLAGALQLSLISGEPSSRLRAVPTADLLAHALSPLVAPELIAQAARALGDGGAQAGALDPVADAIGAAASDDGARLRLEGAAAAIEALLALHAAAQGGGLESARARVAGPGPFACLAYMVLSRPGALPLTILVGGGVAAGARLAIPLEGSELAGQLELSYLAGDGGPRWRTSLWVRRPPDPIRRRLGEWSDDSLADAPTLELYRRQTPGEGPVGVIATEDCPLPHTLATPVLDLLLDLPDGRARAVRTTVRDKYQAPQLIAERVLVAP